jgi:hypothetical protein
MLPILPAAAIENVQQYFLLWCRMNPGQFNLTPCGAPNDTVAKYGSIQCPATEKTSMRSVMHCIRDEAR